VRRNSRANERAARTFQDVLLPILQTVTQGIPPDVACDAIGFEVSYHTRAAEKSYDYEGKELLVIVVDRSTHSFWHRLPTTRRARMSSIGP